jgi:hypothetical protein
LLLFAALALGACGSSDREVRIARARAETRMLATTFDRIEERLLANQARVHLWQELRDRHESVSAIACVSQNEHALAMEQHALPPLPSARSGRAPSARIAAAATGPAKPLIRGSGTR